MNSFGALSRACGHIFHQMLKKSISRIAVISAAMSLAGVFVSSRPSQAQDSSDAELAIVKQYCAGCHSDKGKSGGVSFEGITAASIAKDP